MSPKRCNLKEKIGNGSSLPNTPEFEFWSMVPNPAVPEPDGILSADELFSDGVLLPLDLVSLARTPAGLDQHEAPSAVAEPEARPGPIPDTATGSKRWKDIFKKNDKKSPLNEQVEDVGTRGKEKQSKEKLEKEKKEKRSRSGSGTPELNINIWPFSRSRSAGNGQTRPVMRLGAPSTRKVSSAPCSRSNSAGESKSSKNVNSYRLPSSPGRVGVHVGRSSPIWQPRRGGASTSGSRCSTAVDPVVRPIPWKGGSGNNKKDRIATKARVLNFNAPSHIASAAQLGCSRIVADGGATGRGGGSSLFNLRGLFTKKVH